MIFLTLDCVSRTVERSGQTWKTQTSPSPNRLGHGEAGAGRYQIDLVDLQRPRGGRSRRPILRFSFFYAGGESNASKPRTPNFRIPSPFLEPGVPAENPRYSFWAALVVAASGTSAGGGASVPGDCQVGFPEIPPTTEGLVDVDVVVQEVEARSGEGGFRRGEELHRVEHLEVVRETAIVAHLRRHGCLAPTSATVSSPGDVPKAAPTPNLSADPAARFVGIRLGKAVN